MTDIVEQVKGLATRFWWLRGAAAAMAASALVPQLVELDRYEYLLGVHLVIVAWNEIATRMGRVVGVLPFLPPISAAAVNTMIFAVAIVIPACAAFFRRDSQSVAQVRARQHRSRGDQLFVAIFYSRLSSFIFACAILLVSISAFHELLTFDFGTTTIEYSYDNVDIPSIHDGNGKPVTVTIRRATRVTTSRVPLGLIGAVAFTVLLFVYSLYVFSSVRRGSLFVVTFVICTELLYLASAPWLADAICDLARKELREIPKACSLPKE